VSVCPINYSAAVLTYLPIQQYSKAFWSAHLFYRTHIFPLWLAHDSSFCIGEETNQEFVIVLNSSFAFYLTYMTVIEVVKIQFMHIYKTVSSIWLCSNIFKPYASEASPHYLIMTKIAIKSVVLNTISNYLTLRIRLPMAIL